MLRLLIARHGNTFDKGQEILRVGLRTDLPLSNSGKEQADTLGHYLKSHYPSIDAVFCSELIRTQETASLALKHYVNPPLPKPIALLNEIDYGIDDGKPEKNVIKRLGENTLKAWDEQAVLPEGWLFSYADFIKDLKAFANHLVSTYQDKTLLLVTSNGIARFFPELLPKHQEFTQQYKLKLGTGCVALFTYCDKKWDVAYWGIKP